MAVIKYENDTKLNSNCKLNSQEEDKNTMDQLRKLSQFFSGMIDTIPAKVYYTKNEDILEDIEVNKRAIFEDSNLSKKAKNKRIKLDPNSQKKVSDIATAFCDKKKNDGKMKELKKKLAKRIKELRVARGANDKPKKLEITSTAEKDNKDVDNDKNLKTSKKVPKIFDKSGGLVFSKFDFASHVDLATEEKIEKSKQKKVSLKGLLVKVKKEDEKIEKLATTNIEAASKAKEKRMWKNALEKAEGNKVRDNTKLIEKSLKQKNKLKVKRAKAWDERKKNVEKRKEMKQERRQKNINERKQQTKNKKMKILKKKGRIA
ncbi:hypothetical protein RDWZM_000904 [Blomia tropicalis]|uniref:Surfeit locus protein 6 n=1 Tax=Blomia tropicalis TaxID=40697 RepID=A0A9Q0MB31_BLOTA|nr:hypothetical protein RDWZM_000904 [Blomia tropicalis]